MMPFNQVYRSSLPEGARFKGKLAFFDPGETTGFGIFEADGESVELTLVKQLHTWPIYDAVHQLQTVLTVHKPNQVVFESYRIYNWRTEQHSNSDVPTIQIIGCLKTLCILTNTPFYTQSAQVAKQFVTDEKLEAWGFYHPGLKHGRDAIRHGLYYLTFGPKK